MNGILLVATIAAALIFSNCLIMEGEMSDDNSEVYVAWAYSPSRCQEMLDKEARHHVVITEHRERILMSMLNLGLVPPFSCEGSVHLEPAAAKFRPRFAAPTTVSTILTK